MSVSGPFNPSFRSPSAGHFHRPCSPTCLLRAVDSRCANSLRATRHSESTTHFRKNKPNLAINKRLEPLDLLLQGAPHGPGWAARTARARPGPCSSCRVPATKPSTRIVACTSPVVRDDPRRRNVAEDPRPVGVREHEIVEARNQSHGAGAVGIGERCPRQVVERSVPCSSRNVRSDCRSSEAVSGARRGMRPAADVVLRRRA